MAKTVLLPLLADGAFHSGQELADHLGISRTAVWKQLRKLKDLGLEFEVNKGQGYRIPGGLDLLARDRVLQHMSPAARSQLFDLEVHSSLDSTNAELLRRLDAGAVSGLACTADIQTAGRGRRGRTWVSPFASNIYLSLAWEFEGGVAALEGLSLAVGVAVVDALESLGVNGVTLKWPNDLLFRGAKLGGILIEMVGDVAGSCQVVVGLGLNVRMPDESARGIDQAWTELHAICAEPPGRNPLLAALLENLLDLMGGFERSGFAPWRERWQQLDSFAGQPVVVSSGEQRTAGTCMGIDDTGALVLKVGEMMQVFHGGEVSLRPDA